MAPGRFTGHERGQAAVEYVGLVALVAVALAALAVLVPRPAHEMLSIVERAICTGLGRGCELGGEDSLALEPCPVMRSTTEADVNATVLSVRAGGGRTALVEVLSDGRAVVTFADRGDLGVEAGVGASVTSDGRTRGARVEASAGVGLGAGRGYEFADVREAVRFLVEQRRSQDSLGGAASVAAPACGLCDVAGIRQDEPPAPDFTFLEGGGAVRAGAAGGAGPALAGGTAAGTAAMGRRVDHRTGETTTYYRVRGDASADLGGPVAWTGGVGGESVLEYTTAADGAPLSLTIRSTRSVVGRTGHALRAAGGGGGPALRGADTRGDLVEQVASLDLGDRRDREAATGLIEALGTPAAPFALPERMRALQRRLEEAGEFEVRVFAASARESGISGHAALGIKVGGAVARRATEQTLRSAYTSPAGATLYLERTDCMG